MQIALVACAHHRVAKRTSDTRTSHRVWEPGGFPLMCAHTVRGTPLSGESRTRARAYDTSRGGATSSHPRSIDDEIAVGDDDLGSAQRLPRRQLGGLTRREAPAWGLRPTVRFAIASALTVAWVAFGVWVSEPWRDDLEDAIGPVMAWVIPLFLAYVPGLVLGFMVFTLLITRYRELPLEPPMGDWPEGEWPSVTVVVAA
jgi:hypothetical protein